MDQSVDRLRTKVKLLIPFMVSLSNLSAIHVFSVSLIRSSPRGALHAGLSLGAQAGVVHQFRQCLNLAVQDGAVLRGRA